MGKWHPRLTFITDVPVESFNISNLVKQGITSGPVLCPFFTDFFNWKEQSHRVDPLILKLLVSVDDLSDSESERNKAGKVVKWWQDLDSKKKKILTPERCEVLKIGRHFQPG